MLPLCRFPGSPALSPEAPGGPLRGWLAPLAPCRWISSPSAFLFTASPSLPLTGSRMTHQLGDLLSTCRDRDTRCRRGQTREGDGISVPKWATLKSRYPFDEDTEAPSEGRWLARGL